MRHATVLEHWVVVNYRKCLTQSDKGTLEACNSTASLNDNNLQGVFYLEEMGEAQNMSQYRKKWMVIRYHINLFWSGLKKT